MSQQSREQALPLAKAVTGELAAGTGHSGMQAITGVVDLKRSQIRRLRNLAIVIVLVAAVVVLLRYTVLAPKIIPVEAARVTIGVVEQTVSNTRAGTVKVRHRARLSPETGGRVVALPFTEGDHVEPGEILVYLEDSVQQARVELAGEDVQAAEARAEEACLAADLAVKELARFVELKAQGIASDQVLDSLTSDRDRAHAACRAARAILGQARASERLARAELALTRLRAPFAGIIAEVSTEVGEWITPAPPGIAIPPVVDLIDPGSVYITAPIDEMDAERIEVGQEVRLSVDSRQGEHYSGRLVRVAPYVLDLVEQNRTVEVEAELDDGLVAGELLPGTSADMEIIVARRNGVLSIPTGAISQGDEVLVVADGFLQARTITTGLGNWRTTEVLEGLQADELVVVSRSSTAIKAGAQVTVEKIR
jgi:HlyD family secretion protein